MVAGGWAADTWSFVLWCWWVRGGEVWTGVNATLVNVRVDRRNVDNINFILGLFVGAIGGVRGAIGGVGG